MIWAKYFRTWLLVDIVSIFPFDMVALFLGSDTLDQVRILRIVRVLRLVKLVRLLKTSRCVRIASSVCKLACQVLFSVYVCVHDIVLVQGYCACRQQD